MLISVRISPHFLPALDVSLMVGIFGFLLLSPLFSARLAPISVGLNLLKKNRLYRLSLSLFLILICKLSFFNSFFRSQKGSSFVLSRDSVFSASLVLRALARLVNRSHRLLQAVCGRFSCRGVRLYLSCLSFVLRAPMAVYGHFHILLKKLLTRFFFDDMVNIRKGCLNFFKCLRE